MIELQVECNIYLHSELIMAFVPTGCKMLVFCIQHWLTFTGVYVPVLNVTLIV